MLPTFLCFQSSLVLFQLIFGQQTLPFCHLIGVWDSNIAGFTCKSCFQQAVVKGTFDTDRQGMCFTDKSGLFVIGEFLFPVVFGRRHCVLSGGLGEGFG